MLEKLFPKEKPIIGMIHLAGKSKIEKIARALEELAIYESEGVDGAIIEDYHGTSYEVIETLRQSSNGFKIIRGMNMLGDPYSAFNIASNFGIKFIQFDSVHSEHLNLERYYELRRNFPDIAVFGGIRFKYINPTDKSLEEDIYGGRLNCDAIVTTGDGTGIETPIQKLKDFKIYLPDFPLIVGAGVNLKNVSEQLSVCDGAIIGSYFKPNKDTQVKVDQELVNIFMHKVKEIRNGFI